MSADLIFKNPPELSSISETFSQKRWALASPAAGVSQRGPSKSRPPRNWFSNLCEPNLPSRTVQHGPRSRSAHHASVVTWVIAGITGGLLSLSWSTISWFFLAISRGLAERSISSADWLWIIVPGAVLMLFPLALRFLAGQFFAARTRGQRSSRT